MVTSMFFCRLQDEQNSKMLLTKLSALSQEIKMEKRSRRRTQKFYKSLVDSSKNNVFEVAKNDKAAKGKAFRSFSIHVLIAIP